MDYQQTIDFLFSQLPVYQRDGKAAYKANLDNTMALDHYFKSPHTKYVTVHIAGTNGKGSVSHLLAAILQKAGYKTGLYTSPHLKDFRERIKINGEMISENEVVDFVEENKDILNQIKPSFFEMTVALAFDFFAKRNIDIAIIETGMGGRLDSTNIIQPLLSIITNIGFDHTAFLGKELKDIAYEKAGIIKENTPIIIGEWNSQTATVFMQQAIKKTSPIVFADRVRRVENFHETDDCQSLTVYFNGEPEYLDLELDLLGDYQKKNILTVLTALDYLSKNITINVESIREGVKNATKITGLRGRWQRIGENPKIICDTGHNVDGIAYVVKQLKKQSFEKLHIVFGMVNDKEIDNVLEQMPQKANYYFTKANIPRAMGELELMRKAKKFGLNGSCYANVGLAIQKAKERATSKDFIFIGGSTFIVAEIPDL